MIVEVMTIHDGLLFYDEHNLHGIVLKSNFKVLVEMLCVGTFGNLEVPEWISCAVVRGLTPSHTNYVRGIR